MWNSIRWRYVVCSIVYKLAELLMTFPSTTPNAERPFSALRSIIKIYSDTRTWLLINLAVICTEKRFYGVRKPGRKKNYDHPEIHIQREEWGLLFKLSIQDNKIIT